MEENTAILEKPGICSLTKDGQHILMFDVDIKGLEYSRKIADEFTRIAVKFNLSDIYILKTLNGYHAYCLDKKSLKEIFDILKEFKFEDENHAYIGYKYRKHWVLRLGKDITHLDTITRIPKKEFEPFSMSNAHRLLLNRYYGLDIRGGLNYDNYTDCLLIRYPQRGKGHETKNKKDQ